MFRRSIVYIQCLPVTESFAGIGNPHAIGPLAEGATVVDIGCGARYGVIGVNLSAIRTT